MQADNYFSDADFGKKYITENGKEAILVSLSDVAKLAFRRPNKNGGFDYFCIDYTLDGKPQTEREGFCIVDEAEELLKDRLDVLYMNYLSQVSLWKSRYKELLEKSRNIKS